jgi:hypothetical protein
MRAQLRNSHVAKRMHCTNELIFVNAAFLIEVHQAKEVISKFGCQLVLIDEFVPIKDEGGFFFFAFLFTGHQ